MPSTSQSNAFAYPPAWLAEEQQRDTSPTQFIRGIRASPLGRRFWIEEPTARPSGCLSHRATRRLDDEPVWIVIPVNPRFHGFTAAMPFVHAAQLARRLRHPFVLRTLETGLLDDGRPYVAVERVSAGSMATWLAHCRKLSWDQVRTISLRLCSAVEAARLCGLAPRDLDLDGCLHVRDGIDGNDIRLGELFVPAASRPPETDAPAIAMMIHALGGGHGNVTEAGALGNVLIRALGNNGYANAGELAKALAAIEREGMRPSQGANCAAAVGQFEGNVDDHEAAVQQLVRQLHRAPAEYLR